MGDVTLPTPGEVEGMRERHVAIPGSDIGGPLLCERCMFAWPCDAARLLALVDSQSARLAAVLAECDLLDVARALGHVWTYGQIQERIRRAATGEAT